MGIVVFSWATESAQASHTRKLIAGSELDFAPYSYVDESNRPTGFAVELLESVARTMNLDIEVEGGAWGILRQKLEAGEIDILPFMAYNTERAQKVEFSDPYISLYDAIFVREGSTSVESESDLAGKRVIVMAGDAAHDHIREAGTAKEILAASTFFEALKLLSLGEGDAVVCPQVPCLKVLRDAKIRNVNLARDPVMKSYSREVRFATKKGDTHVIEILNEGLKAVKASGEYDRLYKKWFSSYTFDPTLTSERMQVLYFALLAAVVIAIGGLAGAWFFKREVARKAALLAENKARLETSARLSELGVMAGGIAHEINNPLAIILGRADQLQRLLGAEALDRTALQKAVDNIQSTTFRISKTISSLRVIAREAENDPSETFDVGDAIEDALRLCRERFKRASIELVLIEKAKGLSVKARHVQVSQILINLLNNALDAVISATEKRVELIVEKRGGAAALIVRDHGAGVPEGLQDKIFQPFFTTKAFGAGTGLGLSISRGLAEANGGRLVLEASEHGAKFVLTLPIAES